MASPRTISALAHAHIMKVIDPRMTPCDHCGARPELRENDSDYGMLPKMAIVCPNGCAIAEQDADAGIFAPGHHEGCLKAAESALLNWNRAHYVYASWRPT